MHETFVRINVRPGWHQRIAGLVTDPEVVSHITGLGMGTWCDYRGRREIIVTAQDDTGGSATCEFTALRANGNVED